MLERKATVKYVDSQIEWQNKHRNNDRVQIWELQRKLELLEQFLGVHYVDTRNQCYVKKGGPEKSNA